MDGAPEANASTSGASHHGGDYFFFFFAAFFVAKSLTPLRHCKLEPTLHSLDQHVVYSFKRIGADFSEAFVTLQRCGNRSQWGLPFNLQPAFD